MKSSEITPEFIRRKELADFYFDNYVKYSRKKKFQKASELLWGALNNVLYAIALKVYGIKLGKHHQIKEFINKLSTDYQDPEIAKIYTESAEIIHANFYHDFLDEDAFKHHAKNVEKLIEKLVAILEDRL